MGKYDPIITQMRLGTSDSPFQHYPSEQHQVMADGVVVLTEVPSLFNHVKVTGNNVSGSSVDWVEVDWNSQITDASQYKVNYASNMIYFDPSVEGSYLSFEYYGRGIPLIPSSMIYTKENNGTVTEVLQDVLNNADSLLNLSSYFTIVGDYDANTIYHMRNIVRYDNGIYMSIDDNSEGIKGILPTDTNHWQLMVSFATLVTQVEQAITDANTARDNANTAATNANTSATNADNKAQYAQEQGDAAKNLIDTFIYKGAYDPSTAYVPYNIVSFDGGTYRCIQNSTGNDPTHSDYWVIEAQAGNIKPFDETWEATDGQTVFKTTNPYNPNNGTLNLYVGGIYQPTATYTQTDAYTITLSEGVSVAEGETVYVNATWFMNNIDSTADIRTISGYSETIGDTTTLLTDNKTLAGAINDLSRGVSEYEWTATDGQLTYNLPDGQSYDPTSKWFEVVVGGAPIPLSQITMDSETQFTLNVDASMIPDGVKVFARWTEPFIPATSGHHTTHELGGYDEIDVTKLKNFQEQVAAPLADIIHIDVKHPPSPQVGAKGDGSTDDTTAIQNIISNAPEGSIVYFPIGSYLISSGLTITKEITLQGCASSTREDISYPNYSKIVLKAGTSNVDMIKQTTSFVRCTIKNLVLWSSSYTQSLNSNKPVSGSPSSIYNVNTINTGVNGINLQSQGSIIENVSVIGCSGTGIIVGRFNYARFCYTYNCGVGFLVDTDNSLVQNRANQCGHALSITGVANVITNFRIDGASAEAILLTNAYRNILDDIQTDQINYCAISMSNSNYNEIRGDFSRVGQYYGGTEIASITDAEKYKACAIYFSGTNKYNIIDFFSSCEELLDDSLTTSYGPATKIVNNGFLISSNIRVAGDVYNGTGSAPLDVTTTTGLNRLVYNVSGGALQFSMIHSRGNDIKFLSGSTPDYATINGVRGLNTTSPNYLTPNYIGEMVIYNGSLFVGTGLAQGNWKLYGSAFPSTSNVLANNGTIGTNGVSFVRLNPSASVTGIILNSGILGGQEITLINESANTITFASSGSNIYDGSSDVIVAGTSRKYVWDSGTSLWYKVA